ncbi:hypothetical protein DDQ68_10285 [Hymenobacter nivis]|uniref:Uncharacterized protein n=1 Tax=Hymenobacter nivis TaxID=1850093 RepID=A0A2Z3GWR3_9BACT|nr:hypothetical protein DDQ68_10285 [Hymenobacter nivis]
MPGPGRPAHPGPYWTAAGGLPNWVFSAWQAAGEMAGRYTTIVVFWVALPFLSRSAVTFYSVRNWQASSLGARVQLHAGKLVELGFGHVGLE